MRNVSIPAVLVAVLLVLFSAAEASASAGDALAYGHFSGASRHTVRGEVSLVATENGHVLRLSDEFFFDGAPDPKLGFGKNGFVRGTLFSALRDDTGAQEYALPADFDPKKYDEVWIWCERFNVPLGKAKLR